MKTKSIFLSLVAILAFFMCSCSNDITTEQEKVENLEEIQMQELIQYVQDLRPQVMETSYVQTRGINWKNFFKWFKKIGKTDQGGYRWARDNGLNWGKGLVVGAATSIVAAIGGDDARVQWRINNEWQTYPSTIRDYEELGNKHNQIIYELCKENPSLRPNSNIGSSSILSIVQKKTKALGYDSELNSIQRTSVILMLDELKAAFKSSNDVTHVFTKKFPSSKTEYDFIDEYLETILVLNSKQEMISTTKQVYSKIDSLPNVKKSLLKDMVSIALCSVNLWQPIE